MAAAQFPVSAPGRWEDFATMLAEWVGQAARQKAKLLVFPEYGAMSLAAVFTKAVRADLRAQIREMQALRQPFLDVLRELCRIHDAYILCPSFPWECAPDTFRNRAWFIAPDGRMDFQDKQVMTRFERERWDIRGGTEQKVFSTTLGMIGIATCYDAEFPLLVRAQVDAGAQLILVPSCTDTLAGWQRVRIGARARALENQCFVAQAPLVGDAPWSPAIDTNIGAAGIFGPPDTGFPDDGILAEGTLNDATWILAEIDFDRVRKVRDQGQVLNHRHWSEHVGPALASEPPAVTVIPLG